MAKDRNDIVEISRQSKPVDPKEPYDPSCVAGKTIVITGGASGFGEGFSRKWAEHGANVIVGDINDARGKGLVAELRKQTGNLNHHYIHCDVTNWQSQVDFFRSSAKLSPSGGIDSVVANAGIFDGASFEMPTGLDAEEPPKYVVLSQARSNLTSTRPNFRCFEVNLLGVMYTAHLAFFYLPRNPRSQAASPLRDPAPNVPDRHLLLIGSVASITPLPGLLQYCVSKHGVLGMFRSLRSTAFTTGIRVNMLCPYFIDTPLIPAAGRLLLAGSAMGKPEDVIDAGTRLMADTRISGRALVIGPKVKVDDGWQLLPEDSDAPEVAVWEAYAHDLEQVEAFSSRFVGMLNAVEKTRGWVGWASDIVLAFAYPIRIWWRG
jgi:NAD(P)-dependent dehydrogenase (short-subunit alcohol dehydrogenase family)